MITLGHVPLSVSVIANDDVSIPQLSLTLPPPERNEAYDVNGVGISPLHSNVRSPGQVITGLVISSTELFVHTDLCFHRNQLSSRFL